MLKEQSDGPHPDRKSMQSVKCYQQATSDYQRVIPGRYNSLEEVDNMNEPAKYYFIKNNRTDSNVIVSAMEAQARQSRAEF